ncbi:MAG: YajQ family cyclic di-GMP-binding protein [Burkholderiales bacterium]|nr:YajQ family cyclic di-GMP-binding protein [Burkholderiales bacterium]
MPSFDVVLEPDLVELRNAVEQANKEIGTRFDFKGSSAQVELTQQGAKQRELSLLADSDFQLDQVREVMLTRLAKRGVDVRYLELGGTPLKLGGDRLRLPVPVKNGIDADTARRVQQALKSSKLKVQAAVQGDSVRVSGAKRDDLQSAIALLRRELDELPLGFNNFRA